MGLERFAPTGYGSLELGGSAMANDKKVEVPMHKKVGRNYYRYEKESRLGGAIQFRDGYSLTRREPPQPR